MSGSVGTQEQGGEGGAPPKPLEEMSVEDRARLWGWKPKEEFNGKSDKWVSAEQFVARGMVLPAVLQERNRKLEDDLARTHTTLSTLEQRANEQGVTITELTNMLRAKDAREYQGAKRHLERIKADAKASGDMEAFEQATTDLAELERNPPQAPASTVTGGAGDGAGGGGGAQPVAKTPEQNRAEQAFVQRNTWYGRRDHVQQETDALYIYLQASRRDLTPDQQLAEVERRMKLLFPTETGAVPAGGGGGGAGGGEGGGAPAVTGGGENSGGGGGNLRGARQRRDFASMPKESKDAYRKYKAQLAGKGDPLTETEWAENYWEQFPEDEAA